MKKKQLVALILAVYLAGVGAYAYYSYQTAKETLFATTDRMLMTAASAIPKIAGPGFHDHLTGPDSHDEAALRTFVTDLTDFQKSSETAFLYTVIGREGLPLFVASSIAAESDWTDGTWNWFFKPYKEPPGELLQSLADGKIRFAEYQDEFGSFRSVFMPFPSAEGGRWIAGADIKIDELHSALRRTVFNASAVAVYFLLLVGPIALIYVRILQQDHDSLEIKVQQRTTELSKVNNELSVLSNKLSKYLSPQIYESIFTGKQDVQIASKRKLLTVFLSDIKDFTVSTDALEPEVMTEYLNHYLNAMSEIALRHGATIDKFIGDAILVFFGDPETRGPADDALACVRMAINMRNEMENLRLKWQQEGFARPFRIRIGITTGYCTVGNFGSDSRLDYTIIGSVVNLAARLQSEAPVDGILVSEDTFNLIQSQVACHSRNKITAKGFPNPVPVWEVEDFREVVEHYSDDIKAMTNAIRDLESAAAGRPWRGEAARILALAAQRLENGDSGPVAG